MSAFDGGFNRSMQHRAESIGGGFKAQGLSRTLIEPQGDPAQVRPRETRKLCSPREILSQQAVGVLATAALPRTAGIAESAVCTLGRQIGQRGRDAMRIQVDIRKGLVAPVAALLYASPRDFTCSANVFICVCMNSL